MSATPGRLVIIREGCGEEGSIENLVYRVGSDIGVIPETFWSLSRSPQFVISTAEQAVRAAHIAATLNPAAALLTADLEDSCPAATAPQFAAAVRDLNLQFPIAILFFYREFETLAISVARSLQGKELISPNRKPILTLQAPEDVPDDPESSRDAKGWVGRNLLGGVSYKPTIHQLPLTRAMAVSDLRAAGLSSFRRLENALQFLASEVKASRNGTYPQ